MYAFVDKIMLVVCVLYISSGSTVSANSCGCVVMGSIVLFICRCKMVLYYARSGVNSVHVVLSGLSMRLLYFVHVCIFCKYGCMYALAAFLLVFVDVKVMSSAYEVSFSGAGGCVMCRHTLKCGCEDSAMRRKNWRCIDVYYLKVLYDFRSLM